MSLAASVHARLVNHARSTSDVGQDVMIRYANERLLYRLAQSPSGQDFVLKGATLFTVWFGRPHRATRDIDLLGRGEPDVPAMIDTFRSVCATAVEAMVVLDLANSRMKDFYDIRLLSQRFTFGPELGRAIRATFARRATPVPEGLPVALTERFALDATKQTQWNAWVRKSRAPGAATLPEVVADLAAFLGPHLQVARAFVP